MRRLFLPVLLLGGTILAARSGLVPETLLVDASRVGFALAFLLAFRFHRGRTASTAALLALVCEVFRLDPAQREDYEPLVFVLLPLHLAVLGWLRDWRVLSRAGALRFAVFAAMVAAVFVLGNSGPEGLRAVLTATWAPGEVAALEWLTGLPAAGVLSFAGAAFLLFVSLLRRRTPIEAGLLGALIATFLGWVGDSPAPAYDLGAALILTLSLIENAFSLAFEDGLTGLPARRSLEETLVHLGRTYAIAMVDLDHFKKFNDRHGHEVGDQVLQMVASKLARVRGGGRSFRYGGEEFSVVFAGKTATEAEPFVEELRRTISETPFAVRSPGRPRKKPKGKGAGAGSSKNLRVTVSIGLAERSAKARTPEEVMKAADKALYRSKKAGRNRVTVGR